MRITVKVGTSTLAHATGRLNIQRMEGLCKVLSDLKNAGHGEHLRRIAELTGRLVPLLEELKSLGYTREQLLVLWEGGEGK